MSRNRCLTYKEEAALRKVLSRRGDLPGRRDYGWIRLLLTTGMRLTETSLLSVGDADAALSSGYLYIPREHRKMKVAELSVLARGEVRDALKDLLSVRAEITGIPLTELRRSPNLPLIVGHAGYGAMSQRQYQKSLKAAALDAGIDPGISPHWLRHTFAVTYLEKSEATPAAALVRLKNLLGHRDSRSCMEYLTMSREDVGDEIQRIFPSRARVTTASLRKGYLNRQEAT